jgi:protein ImuA
MPDSSASIARLKRRIDALSRSAQGPAAGQVTPNHSTLGQFTLGLSAIDARLGGGLARKGLHEVVAMAGDHPAASGFALMLAARAVVGDAPILVVSVDRYLREQGGLYAPGLIDLGLDPDRIMLVHAPDEMAALKVAADSLNCSALGAAIIDAGEAKKLDLTASRRLLLAIERSGVTGIILRSGASHFASAASTRWAVAAAPSTPLPGNAPGQTLLRVELLRHRGGIAPFHLTMEWDRDQKTFREPTLLRDFSATAEQRQMAA